MKITLSKVSYCAALSEETSAFSATVHLNGEAFATVENRGHGGCNDVRPLYVKASQSYEHAKFERCRNQIREWCAAQPLQYHATLKNADGSAWGHAVDLESLIDDALESYLQLRDLKRKLSKYLVFERLPGAAKDDVKILNKMPEADALALWRTSKHLFQKKQLPAVMRAPRVVLVMQSSTGGKN